MLAARDCFLLMLVLSANFGRSFLRYSTTLPMKYFFVVTAATGFAVLTDLLIIISGKFPCIGWGKLSLQDFTTFFD